MADTFKFELVTPERMADVAGRRAGRRARHGGRFTVLPGHAPVISALRPGMIELTLSRRARRRASSSRAALPRWMPRTSRCSPSGAWDVEQLDQATIASELQAAEAELAAAASDTARLAAASAVEQLKALQR